MKGKAVNAFNLAADMQKGKRDNSEAKSLSGGPGGQPQDIKRSIDIASRLKKGNEIHLAATKPKGPEPGR